MEQDKEERRKEIARVLEWKRAIIPEIERKAALERGINRYYAMISHLLFPHFIPFSIAVYDENAYSLS